MRITIGALRRLIKEEFNRRTLREMGHDEIPSSHDEDLEEEIARVEGEILDIMKDISDDLEPGAYNALLAQKEDLEDELALLKRMR